MVCSLPDDVQVPTVIVPLPPARWAGTLSSQPALPFMSEVAVQPGSLPSLTKALEAVPEHRKPRGFKPNQPPVPLIPTLLMLLLGVACGRGGYGSMETWGRQLADEQPEVVGALGFAADRRPRTPGTSTFFRLVRDMNWREFQAALEGWLEEVAIALRVCLPEWEKKTIPDDQIAVDGKTVRGASARRQRSKREPGPGFVHLVAAYVPALKMVVAQVTSEGKGHELAAVKLLLGQIDLKGKVITADALACQREICETITDGEGDYLFPVDNNQPTLLADIQESFSPSAAAGPADANCAPPGRGPGQRDR